MTIYQHERSALKRTINFFERAKRGYEMALTRRITELDPEVPTSYNRYLKVRQQLPSLSLIQKPEQIKSEINNLATILRKLDSKRTLKGTPEEEIEKAVIFFSRLGEIGLEEAYLIQMQSNDDD